MQPASDRPPHPVGVGIVLPTREAAISGHNDPHQLLQFAHDCEHLGFDSVWAGDSLLARPRFEPLTLLAAIAARTEHVTIGTAALTPAIRHPLPAAHAIATLDRISDGRLTLAIGAGFPYAETVAEFAAVGVPFTRRLHRLRETVALWRRAWTASGDEPVPFDGALWQVSDVRGLPPPAQPGGPDVWYAGAGPAGLALAADELDGWLHYAPTPAAYSAARHDLHMQARRAGRPPGAVMAAVYVTVLIGDPAATSRELDGYFTAYYGIGLEHIQPLQAVIHGHPDQCLEQIRCYVAAGVRHIVIRIGSLDAHAHLPAIADCVLPAFQKACLD
jgi:alkanesulfonate monooxygenase SsuD/methylene tetrahydromethanopterin reductase-like flavin-dependent oxidoreductase (luciferase family)